MAATNSAASSSVTSSSGISSGNLVNIASADPAQARYPGAVDPTQYTDPGPHRQVEGPVAGNWTSEFGAQTPPANSGGGVVDATYLEGSNGPMVPWDSSAGQPFAPSGALNPDLHAQDLGAVWTHSQVVPAFIGQLLRHTSVGQTHNKEAETQTEKVSFVPNDRINYGQSQFWDPAPGDGGGYAPWDPGYAERPVLLNVAYQANEVTPVGNQYGVNGVLPDRSQWNHYQASAYESPVDPIVSQPPAPQEVPSSSGGWLLNG